MAFVVRRPRGRYEIRESRHTKDGPRARTLATFAELDDDILGRAERAATTPFDRGAVVASARKAGAPLPAPTADQAARRLLLELRAGRRPSAGMSRLLVEELTTTRAPRASDLGDLADWIDASDEQRGKTLRDLIDLGDSLPHSRQGPLKFPPLGHQRHGR
jgi:hypothetical protein